MTIDMEKPGENLYVPYCDTREAAQDIVSQNSILCEASGKYWRGDECIFLCVVD